MKRTLSKILATFLIFFVKLVVPRRKKRRMIS